MTRLKVEDIKDIPGQLDRYESELMEKTGCTLREIACHAVGIEEESLFSLLDSVKFAVVPVESGQGIIEGFCETISDIVWHIGFDVFVTGKADVAGIAQAVEKKAEVVMMADDHRFMALNIKSGHMSDNAKATGKGYAAGLDLMAGGLKGRKVFITGCGPVGWSAALAVLQRGAEVSVFDTRHGTAHLLAKYVKELMNRTIVIEESLEQGLSNHHYIIEATNAAGIIDENAITRQTHIAAPGMPLGLTPEALRKISGRLLHDPLQIGTAVMAVEAGGPVARGTYMRSDG